MVRSVVVCVLALLSLLSGTSAYAISVDAALTVSDSSVVSIELAVVERVIGD